VKINFFLKKQRSSPVFHLSGGIGNQLFGYAAGKAYSRANNKTVRFDLSDIGKGFTNHGSSINALSLDLEIASNKSSFQKFQIRVFNKCDRIIYRFTGKKLPSLFNYYSHEIGFDEVLLEKKHKIHFRGYFQSWKYVETVFDVFPPSEKILNQPSEWFQNMSSLAIHTKPIIIHVRRGDYKKLANTYGLLSKDYYSAALSLTRDYLPDNPIWILSDDLDDARKILQSTLPNESYWISPPLGTDPVESLVLMSFGAANIIGNSTFSWWGAMLNRHSKITVAPEKWFKGMADPKHLYPQGWRLVPSSWEN
jgi:hypothetical protein